MVIITHNPKMPKNRLHGENNNLNCPFTGFLKTSTSILHGTRTILTNGFTEEVNVETNSVEVTGKVIHRLACLVPHVANGADGFEYVVPLLIKENADRSNMQGLIVSKGFIPFSMREPGLRYRIENTDKQTFVGFVSQL